MSRSFYNELRPHSGPRCYGKTPMQTFIDGKKIALEKQLDKCIDVGKMKLDATDKFSLENLSQSVSIVPSTETIISDKFHGTKQKEVVTNLYLTDNSTVS